MWHRSKWTIRGKYTSKYNHEIPRVQAYRPVTSGTVSIWFLRGLFSHVLHVPCESADSVPRTSISRKYGWSWPDAKGSNLTPGPYTLVGRVTFRVALPFSHRLYIEGDTHMSDHATKYLENV